MKKYLIILLIGCTNLSVSGQTISYSTLKSNASISPQQIDLNSISNKPKNKSDIMAENNALCKFVFDDKGIYSAQDSSKDYVVYEKPNMSASELKAAVLSAISSLFKSPKDVVTNLGDNIIQLERYAPDVYYGEYGNALYPMDIYYTLIIQFKDGKIRYNAPSIKQLIVTRVPMVGSLRLDTSKPVITLIKDSYDRKQVAEEFNNTISIINHKTITADDW